ncbi:MFS transporter, DHA1 family, bicyclomycin/chloramphenicol resistance protein [Pseudomonas linyingensis]|uniref:Bcr/CflA family efflux transporter n=2 Tax=Pseudomonas linyingensis TaxID=915471 RepID=A0A1H7AI63_9PSED|nr:MFS transporter, DHA1 family, bicyclomycin/chloramphenicol resistance protein [Pseudomonas linyingensis]
MLLLLLGTLTAIAPMSTDMYLPAFPAIQTALELAPGEVELSFSAYFVGMLLGMLCYGPISDRFGRKPPLLFGLSLYTLASLLLAGSDSLTELIGWRFVQGLGGCAGAVLAVAIVRDRCTPQQAGRVMSLITLVMGVAPVFAPLAGGLVLELWGWHAIFVALAGFGVCCLLGLLTVLDESLAQRSASLALRPVLAGYGQLLRDRRFIGYSLSQACTTGAMFAYIVGSPFVLIDLHGVSPQRFGLFFGINAIGLVLASQLVRLLLRRHSPLQLLPRLLWAPLLAGSLLVLNQLIGVSGLWLILPAFFVLVSSVGLVGPNATALAMAEQGARAGQASALHVSLTFGMGMLAGLLVSRLHDGSLLPLALVVFCFNVAGLLAWRLRSEPLAEPAQEVGV